MYVCMCAHCIHNRNSSSIISYVVRCLSSAFYIIILIGIYIYCKEIVVHTIVLYNVHVHVV